MAYYRVTLKGEGFPVRIDGRWCLFRFHTAKCVAAESWQAAEVKAVRAVIKDPVWAHIRPRPGFPTPRITPEAIEAIAPEDISAEGYVLQRTGK